MEKKETYHILEDEKTTVLTKKQFDQELEKVRKEGIREGYRCPYCMFIVSTVGQLRHHIQVRHKKEFKDS